MTSVHWVWLAPYMEGRKRPDLMAIDDAVWEYVDSIPGASMQRVFMGLDIQFPTEEDAVAFRLKFGTQA